jgi:hypothetical protein
MGVSQEELRGHIARAVGRQGKTNRDCYHRWRGAHELLTAEDIRDGLARDAGLLVATEEVEALIELYGGPMTLSTFVRMLGECSPAPAETEDGAAISKIAGRLRGDRWEEIILRSTSVEDICLGFAREGIAVQEPEITLLISKLGRIGFVTALRARMK